MSNFHVKKPVFRTWDILGLIGLVVLLSSVSGTILAQALQNDKPRRALSGAQMLAQQLRAEQMLTGEQVASQRGPASERVLPPASLLTSGVIGHDPWGRPFRYYIHKEEATSDAHHKLHGWVYVWSDGPDGKSETDLAKLPLKPQGSQLILGGDDVGHVEEFILEL